MIGAVVFELVADNDERVSDAQGRLLHGAFFALLEETDPGLAFRLHDGTNVKPFSIAPLELPLGAPKVGRDRLLRAGDVVYWRIAALDETVLRALLAVTKGSVVRVGRLRLILRRVIADSGERPDVGVLDEMELIGACLAEESVRSIELRFLTPVECERLNGFPDGWTDTGMPEKFRYFCMGNALVVPLITRMGKQLIKIIK